MNALKRLEVIHLNLKRSMPFQASILVTNFGNEWTQIMTIKLDFQTVKNIKKPGRYTDALVKGLHVWVKPNLNKYWIFRYTHNQKQHNISLGSFPALSISDARLKAQQARDELDKGTNPVAAKNASKALKQVSETEKIRFKEFAHACIQTKRSEWTNQKHGDQWEYTLEEFAYPVIGEKHLDEITMEDVLEILTPIWTTKTETASRLRGRLEWVLAAATTRKLRSGINPAQWKNYLQTILPAPNKIKKVEHHKALPYRQVPALMAQLREMDTMAALALEFHHPECLKNRRGHRRPTIRNRWGRLDHSW